MLCRRGPIRYRFIALFELDNLAVVNLKETDGELLSQLEGDLKYTLIMIVLNFNTTVVSASLLPVSWHVWVCVGSVAGQMVSTF